MILYSAEQLTVPVEAFEFPYSQSSKHDWSAMYADYAERTKAMSTFACLMHKKMCLADAMITLSPQGKASKQAASSGSRTIQPNIHPTNTKAS